MEIIRAKPDDAPTLTEIAFAAKRYWRYPERWIEIWSPLLIITPDYISSHDVYVAQDVNGLVGFYALSVTGMRLSLDHLWVRPEAIGQGVGRALFLHAKTRAQELGAREMEIEADPNAEGFYLRMDARRVGENRTQIQGQSRVLPILVADLS